MSTLARSFQRCVAADHTECSWVGSPLKLPFARILFGARRIGEPYRRFITVGAGA